MKLFDILSCITEKKKIDLDDEETLKEYDIFIINKFLSSIDQFNPILCEIENLELTKKSHFLYLFNAIPKGKYFFKNPSPKKESVDEQRNKMILYKHFLTGTKDMKDILTFMTESEKMELVGEYLGKASK